MLSIESLTGMVAEIVRVVLLPSGILSVAPIPMITPAFFTLSITLESNNCKLFTSYANTVAGQPHTPESHLSPVEPPHYQDRPETLKREERLQGLKTASIIVGGINRKWQYNSEWSSAGADTGEVKCRAHSPTPPPHVRENCFRKFP